MVFLLVPGARTGGMSGRVTAFKVFNKREQKTQIKEDVKFHMQAIVAPFKDDDIFVETTVVEAPEDLSGTIAIMQTVNGMFFPPNTIFYMLEDGKNSAQDKGIIEEAFRKTTKIVFGKEFLDFKLD